MPFRMDPAALYDALKYVYSVTKKPVNVTEFGMATQNETMRELFMQRALYAMYEATREGVPLRGIHAWALFGGNVDVYHEWDQDPVHQDFGICTYTEEGEAHQLRPAAVALRGVIDRSSHVAAEVLRAA